jgi:cytochrome c oxidase cbb3-type subunit 4
MISGIVTAVLLVLFVAGCFWAYSPRRKPEFEAAAREPLNDDDAAATMAAQETRQ